MLVGDNTTTTVGSSVIGNVASLILNGGVIAGTGTLSFGADAAIVDVDLQNGVIATPILSTAQWTFYQNHSIFTKTGPGTLFMTAGKGNVYIGTSAANGMIQVSEGAIDFGTISTTAASSGLYANSVALMGGVIQGNGTLSRQFASTDNFGPGEIYIPTAASAGFAARGGVLNVDLGSTNGTAPALTWGSSTLASASTYTNSSATSVTQLFGEGSATAAPGILLFGVQHLG